VKLCSFEKKIMRSKARKMVMDYVEAPILFKNHKSDGINNVLELGCGAGYGTRNILQRIQPKRLIATDYDPDLVEFARRNTHGYWGGIDVDFRQADATKLQYADNSFDIVVSIGILHHILNYKQALAEMFRVLKPGGILLMEEVMKEAHFWPIGKLLVPAVLLNDSEFIGAVEEQGFSVKILGRYMKAFILLECRKEASAMTYQEMS
jgi:ubiquinone/menaquinone biosynthesis C-methylase UbiE